MSDEPIELNPCESASVKAYGYSAARQVLAVQFHNGHIFHYQAVDVGLYDELLGAESIGKLYAARIKGKFSGEKMTGVCPACGRAGLIDQVCKDCGDSTYHREEKRYSKDDEERAAIEARYTQYGEPRD